MQKRRMRSAASEAAGRRGWKRGNRDSMLEPALVGASFASMSTGDFDRNLGFQGPTPPPRARLSAERKPSPRRLPYEPRFSTVSVASTGYEPGKPENVSPLSVEFMLVCCVRVLSVFFGWFGC